MTSHPIDEPLLFQFLHADSDADRAALMLAQSHEVLSKMQGQYRRVIEALGFAEGENYLDAVMALQATTRDQWGTPPRFLEEQLNAARVQLCAVAGSIAIIPIGTVHDEPSRPDTSAKPPSTPG